MDLTKILKIKKVTKETGNVDFKTDLKRLKTFTDYENKAKVTKKDFYDRYLPKKYIDLFYSRPDTNITPIYMWLKNFKRTRKNEAWNKDTHQSNLLLVGAPGVGKTTIIKTIAKELNIDTLEFNSSNVKNRALFKRQIKQYTEHNDIFDTEKNKMIIIEELESIISCDKTLLADILEILNPKKCRVPIVIIITPQTQKKIKSLKAWTITINKPTKKESTIFIRKVLSTNKKAIPMSSDIDRIIYHVNGDYRQLSYIMDDILNIDKTNIYTEDIKKVLITHGKKETDYSLFELFDKIVTDKLTVDEKLTLSQSDKTMLNYMTFENYPSLTDKEDISTLSEIISEFTDCDLIDLYSFRTQDFSVNEISSLNGIVIPSHFFKNYKSENIKNNYRERIDQSKQINLGNFSKATVVNSTNFLPQNSTRIFPQDLSSSNSNSRFNSGISKEFNNDSLNNKELINNKGLINNNDSVNSKRVSIADKINYPMVLNKSSFISQKKKKLHNLLRKYKLNTDTLNLLSVYLETNSKKSNEKDNKRLLNLLDSYNIHKDDLDYIIKYANLKTVKLKVNSKIKNGVKNNEKNR